MFLNQYLYYKEIIEVRTLNYVNLGHRKEESARWVALFVCASRWAPLLSCTTPLLLAFPRIENTFQ